MTLVRNVLWSVLAIGTLLASCSKDKFAGGKSQKASLSDNDEVQIEADSKPNVTLKSGSRATDTKVETDGGDDLLVPKTVMSQTELVVTPDPSVGTQTATALATPEHGATPPPQETCRASSKPQLAATKDRTGVEMQNISFQLDATDADASCGDTLTFRCAENCPAGLSVSETGTVSWKPTYAQAGLYQPVFRVTDGSGNFDEKSTTITVANACGVTVSGHTPPINESSKNVCFRLGKQAESCTKVCRDANGDVAASNPVGDCKLRMKSSNLVCYQGVVGVGGAGWGCYATYQNQPNGYLDHNCANDETGPFNPDLSGIETYRMCPCTQ